MSNQEIVQKELELARSENELLRQKIEHFERQQIDEQAKLADATLHAEEQRQSAAATQEANEQRKFAEQHLPRPENMKGFLALSSIIRSRFYEAYGSDFAREIREKDASGLSWGEWDRLYHPERFQTLEEEQSQNQGWKDYTDPNGLTLHFDQRLNRWLPGPTRKK